MLAERAPHLLNSVSENLKFLQGKIIGIDIDATMQATFILAERKASKILGKVILHEHLVTYWELAAIAERNGISKDLALDFSKKAWNDDFVYRNAPAMPGAKTFLETLRELKIPHIFVSSRPVEFLDVTREWFKDTFQVQGENIILGRREGISGGDFKAEMVRKYGIGLFIDDALEEAEIIADKTKIPVLVVPQPWNIQAQTNNLGIKLLGEYSKQPGIWPVLRFLIGDEAKEFFNSVAQSS